ncbi:MAG: sodium:solute symporter [Ignavibacteria bacterium RIFOXYB2_FULL_35_12]|nr:MAG: sodium:solute symporter [Ignavibacteria bacterium GWA2_36_19]OGU62257.1 MAG: sodium:solute symporter [Ignavibacteria bacterium GWF2_35_20]OGU81078.1 MAG: sodium:solute symporter [Ignavibacteria bacterium RIFOXYA2_FULL_35_9]OGU84663.1 MAG: sodium:solute symporter [Ignavibacteria bacterium RIFOXYA12_FULL_35_25]OGU96955.1 MAG: sodium:solute symporter [Ignavibacteria bacterium RIFOXYB12_FULL_35_14]OGV00612.1 MAG: sodium:solute symporter [Ignavibacteria bacterium RIFOXYC2_FULL_35_16]OGV055
MCGFLTFVVIYGVWKTRKTKDLNDYILTSKTTPWYIVAISIMATQASAITFLSTPGQAYVDGMRFIQFYIGLPIAMVILSITAVPLYHKLNVYTAYEYLEHRFDLKNRILGSVLFLIQRGLAAGFTIFAPSLIISLILNWDINITIVLVGVLVIIYTTVGGTIAVNKTHIQQMAIIFIGMIAAFITIIYMLPENVSFFNAAVIAGKMGKLNTIDFSFNFDDRYTFWSGLIGGTFLMLSYFGTDQSQVQRYLGGSSITQSRLGLLVNGIVKIPMQVFILFTGVMVFVFYQFITPPLFFNPAGIKLVENSIFANEYHSMNEKYKELSSQKSQELNLMLDAINKNDAEQEKLSLAKVENAQSSMSNLRSEYQDLMKKENQKADTNDTNYIFLSFVTNYLPIGLIGLVLAAIFSASMSSTSAELNALASTTVIDIYKRVFKRDATDHHYVFVSKISTVLWGVYAIGFALFANKLGSLIEAVNILGSIFYGTILGIFLVAFYFKKVKGTPTFIAAIVAEITVLCCFFFTGIPFLWFNVIGCVLVVVTAILINQTKVERLFR